MYEDYEYQPHTFIFSFDHQYTAQFIIANFKYVHLVHVHIDICIGLSNFVFLGDIVKSKNTKLLFT